MKILSVEVCFALNAQYKIDNLLQEARESNHFAQDKQP